MAIAGGYRSSSIRRSPDPFRRPRGHRTADVPFVDRDEGAVRGPHSVGRIAWSGDRPARAADRAAGLPGTPRRGRDPQQRPELPRSQIRAVVHGHTSPVHPTENTAVSSIAFSSRSNCSNRSRVNVSARTLIQPAMSPVAPGYAQLEAMCATCPLLSQPAVGRHTTRQFDDVSLNRFAAHPGVWRPHQVDCQGRVGIRVV